MSMLDQLEENLEAAIARQRAGRVTREQCGEAMACAAMGLAGGAIIPLKTKWKKLRKSKWDTDTAISGDLLSAVISTRYILGFRKDNPNVFNMLVQNLPHSSGIKCICY